MRDKVVQGARELGLEPDVRRLDAAPGSVEEAARAVGCDADEVAGSALFVCDGEPVVCVVSGERRVDPDKLAEARDCAEVREAGPDEVRAATGCPVGAVPPVGDGLPVVVEAALLRRRRIWLPAGDPQSYIGLDPNELVDRVGAEVAELAEVGTAA
jgi:prolyl-tRNA editing enzyme YbaK/EbsC (Cys-tRNA(Pro) deacylase)